MRDLKKLKAKWENDLKRLKSENPALYRQLDALKSGKNKGDNKVSPAKKRVRKTK